MRIYRAVAVVIFVLVAPRVSRASTTITGGNVINETWTAAGSPYLVEGDVTVPAGATLTLQAGTVVQVADTDGQHSGLDPTEVEITIDGTLVAMGTAANPISFTSSNTWYGIIVAADAAGAKFDHVNISKAIRCVYSEATRSVLEVSHTTVSTCGYGFHLAAGASTFDSVTVANNSYGFWVDGPASATISNAVVSGNVGAHGILFSSTAQATTTVMNSTLDQNEDGIYVSTATAPIAIKNSIITNSTYGVDGGADALVTVSYCDVWGNNQNFVNAVPGPGVISQNPNYADPPTDLSLTAGSVCIDVGDATGAPNHDILGALRPIDGDGLNGAQWDMGAYEFAPPLTCGNGIVEGSEACDDGAQNGMPGDPCSADCTLVSASSSSSTSSTSTSSSSSSGGSGGIGGASGVGGSAGGTNTGGGVEAGSASGGGQVGGGSETSSGSAGSDSGCGCHIEEVVEDPPTIHAVVALAILGAATRRRSRRSPNRPWTARH